jgi:hypothetical protein
LIVLGWFLWHSKKEEIIGLGIFIVVLIIVYVIKLLFTRNNNFLTRAKFR